MTGECAALSGPLRSRRAAVCATLWLLLADFDRAVVTIVAQPFQRSAQIDGRIRRHVPDLLLRDGTGAATVVDVKPAGLRIPSGPGAALHGVSNGHYPSWSRRRVR
jgi:hypothetical protein